MSMRLALVLVLVLISNVSELDASSDDQTTVALRRSISPQQAWSISYPKDWLLQRDDETSVLIRTPPQLPEGYAGIHILFRELSSLENFANTMLEGTANMLSREGYRVETISRRNLSLADGTPAIQVEVLIGTGRVGKSQRTYVLLQNTALVLDVEASEKDWGVLGRYFDQIVASFQIETAAPAHEQPASASPEKAQWQLYMEQAHREAAEGKEQILGVEGLGMFVFNNTHIPCCYAYRIPGMWQPGEEPGSYRSTGGQGFFGILFVTARELAEYEGATLVERARNSITLQYERGLGQELQNVRLVPFTSARSGTQKWTADAIVQKKSRIVFPTKIIAEIDSSTVALITVSGTSSDEGLARSVLESLSTTRDPACYWDALEKLAMSLF